MTLLERTVIEGLRDQGFAVSVWTPEELEGAGVSIAEMEDHLGSQGNTLLDIYRDEEE